MAFVIDALIVGVLHMIVAAVVKSILHSEVLASLVALIVTLVYWVFLPVQLGATPGKKAMGLRIVTKDNQLKVPLGTLLFRESLGKLISGLAFGLGYFWVLLNSEHKAWHDSMAGTRVINYK